MKSYDPTEKYVEQLAKDLFYAVHQSELSADELSCLYAKIADVLNKDPTLLDDFKSELINIFLKELEKILNK